MSTSTLPHVAMRLLGDVAYPMRSLVDGAPVATFTPSLPDESFRWADSDEVLPEHLDLTDPAVFAEVLFASSLDPKFATEDEIRVQLHRALIACACNIGECSAWMGQEGGDHPEACAARMTWLRSLVQDQIGAAA